MQNNYTLQIKRGFAWVDLRRWIRPLHTTDVLDDTLDSGNVELSMVAFDNELEPFTRLRLIIKEKDGEIAENTEIEHYILGNISAIRRTYDE